MEDFKNLQLESMQQADFCRIWSAIVRDPGCVNTLTDQVGEEILLKMLQIYGPSQADWVIEDVLADVCEALLPCYHKGYYTLTAWIYGIGYSSMYDPLCGNVHPLIYAARQHNPAFAEALLRQWQDFDVLSFDEDPIYESGQAYTLPELLVLADDVPVMKLCLSYGLNPNTFGYRGNRLLDFARSAEMQALLQSCGAEKATEAERKLVGSVYALRDLCLQPDAVNELIATEPLMKHTWYNSFTSTSREQNADLYLEAAKACHSQLLEQFYPYAAPDLNADRRREILLSVMGQRSTLPDSLILDSNPANMALALEALARAGFRYGTAKDAAEHPLVDLIDRACWTFRTWNKMPLDIQMRGLWALWKICGAPKGETVLPGLCKLTTIHNILALTQFIEALQQTVSPTT